MLLIGRVIGPDAAGVGAIAIAAFLLLEAGAASLFGDALVQHPSPTARHADSAATVSALAGAAAGLALVGTGQLLAAGAALQVGGLTLALAPLLPLSAYSGVAAGLALRAERLRLLALRVLLGQPLALTAGLLVARAGWGAWAMVANQAVATLATFLLMLVAGRFGLRPRFDWGALGELWPVAGPQTAAVVVLVGRYRVFLVAVGLLAAEAAVAQAHVAFRMLDSALAVVGRTVSRVALPRLCALRDNHTALADAYGDLAQLQALMGMPIAVGVALIAPDLVWALLGPSWAGSADAARVAGLAGAVTFAQGNYVGLFVALGKAQRNLRLAALSLAVPLLALAALRPTTPAGVALCWASQSLVLPPVVVWLVLRELHRPPLWLAQRVAPAALATGAMAATVLLVRDVTGRGQLAGLAASVSAGVAVFAAVAWLALGACRPRLWHVACTAPAARTAPPVGPGAGRV